MWINHKKELITGLLFFVFIFISVNLLFSLFSKASINMNITKTAAVIVSSNAKRNIKLAFVGDIMLDRGVKLYVNKYFGGDYAELFVKVEEQLQGYDILVGNLEGPISDNGSDGGNLYSFRFEPKVVSILKDTGFDVFSLANNHIFNWGKNAFTDTLNLLSEAEIVYTGGGFDGEEAYKEKIIDKSGIKIAFLSFGEFKEGSINSTSISPGITLISENEIIKSVSEAKSQADLVVVSYHFGEEYSDKPNSFQKKYAELAIDSGADLIIGHHPHVVQTLEQYKNVYIIYSLGNFIFDQYFSEKTMQGGLLEVEVNSNDKLIEKVTLKKVLLNKKYQIESIE